MREACGLFGMWGDPDAAAKTYYGLFALQHRGQESAGIATTDGHGILRHRGMGTLTQAFSDPNNIVRLKNSISVGHVRYSTTGSSLLQNAQPLVQERSFVSIRANSVSVWRAAPARTSRTIQTSIP